MVVLNNVEVVTITVVCPWINKYYIKEDGQLHQYPIESFTYPDNLQLSEYIRRNKKKDFLEVEYDWLEELDF